MLTPFLPYSFVLPILIKAYFLNENYSINKVFYYKNIKIPILIKMLNLYFMVN